MSEDSISLLDLLNVAIEAPQHGVVNFRALHALLLAVLNQLDIREMKTQWTDSSPGDTHLTYLVDVTSPKQHRHTEEEQSRIQSDVEQDDEPGTALPQRRPSSSSQAPSTGTAADDQWSLFPAFQACEDDVSKAMKVIEKLHSHKDHLKNEIRGHQQKFVDMKGELVAIVDKCCQRVDALEGTVRLMKETLQKYPDPEQLSQCVTWDIMQSALLSKTEKLQEELVNLRAVGSATEAEPTGFEESPTSPVTSGKSSPLQEVTDATPPTEASSVMSPQQTHLESDLTEAAVPLSQDSSISERYSETMEALRKIGKLKENFDKLETRLATVEEGQVDQTELTQLRELISNTGSQDVSNHIMDQLNEQRALIDHLMMMSESEKLDNFMDPSSHESKIGLEGASEGLDSDSRELHELRMSVENLEAYVKQLKTNWAPSEESLTDQHPQDQNEELQNAILQLQAECERLHEENRQNQSHIEELYKTTEELEEKKADKQMVESEIKADKSALDSKVSRLQFDSATEQLNTMFHELLNKVMGQEQDWHKVIDKLSTEMECKLNRIELESMKKQLEDRWKNIYAKLQAQGAPDNDDAAALKKQLMDKFHCLSCDRPIAKHVPSPHLVTLPSTPGFPSHKSIRPFTVYALEQFRQHCRGPGTNHFNFEAANSGRVREPRQKSHTTMCRQLESVQRRHCEKTGRHDTTKDNLKQNQPGLQHERITELTDYSHLAIPRSCGGSHTITSPSQLRTVQQYMKHHGQTEVDGIVQTEVVDILGLDGHIYKGRLNPSATRSTETKLPTISSKDASCKVKDKPRGSPSHKPASPEMEHDTLVQHPHSARSVHSSRSGSSMSSRDWPVSALGCESQSTITSAAAESNSGALDNQQVSL